jgi:hypothetical protein
MLICNDKTKMIVTLTTASNSADLEPENITPIIPIKMPRYVHNLRFVFLYFRINREDKGRGTHILARKHPADMF